MKTNFKLSSKMHLLIIISTVLIALGLMVGVICHFVAGGYFNYGGDWASSKNITVSYAYVDFSDENDVYEICNDAFAQTGLNYQSATLGETRQGGEIVYTFSAGTDDVLLDNAVIIIKTAISNNSDGVTLSTVAAHTSEGLLGGALTLERCAIALAAIIVLHFIYFAVRFKLTMAFAAALADIHNLAVFISLLALTRLPVGSTAIAFAALTVVLTVISTCFLFDRMRKNIKSEDNKKLTAFEVSDKSANESFMINTIMPACLAAISVVLFVLMSISSLSPLAILTPVICSLVAFIACTYGTVFFTPAVYSRFKLLGDNYKQKSAEKAKKIGK